MSPTARCLAQLRKEGWKPWVVERNAGPFKRDLYNCIDLLALRDGVTLAVQVTSGSNHASRLTKVEESEFLADMLAAGWVVEVWSYRKNAAGKVIHRSDRVINRPETVKCAYAQNEEKYGQTQGIAE